MVTGTGPPPAAAPPAGGTPTAGQVASRRWRASRGVLATLLAVVALALGLAALQPSTTDQDLDPESPGPGGTRALAKLLERRGVPFYLARSAGDAAGHDAPGGTMVITRPERLTDRDLALIRGGRTDLVLVDPPRDVLAALAPGVRRAGTSFEESDVPDCPLRAAVLAGSVRFERSETYEVPPGATGCYRAGGLARLVQLRNGESTVTVLGSAVPLTNQRLAEDGNAALGMNLADSPVSITWLAPDLPATDGGGGNEERSLGDLLPFGVKLFFLELLVAVVLVALWRARRLGPVVAERLPVVVRSAEAVEGRARLYRAHRARDRAADALRSGALERLVPLLGLPRSAAQDPAAAREIVTAVAQRTTHDEGMVWTALYGPEPADDGQLVGLTDLLDDLERQVRHS
ncbi:DUF4350 domain-containing protein [Actinomadura viridis]|uniref:DUF4350 domain-containing protein n=1 Tax=Actinomadura viridis TaxID=58110 RepID=A0A931DFQ6_9ACTN|nr:DUF4350 domain-containing protein [Actinomadura viridis]MBG6086716.1 hypothetical protein [Actinomadura viridis]